MHDVVICGGGLAGLTLAIQLRRRLPSANIAVIERQRRPLPEACHKVGESSVEIGACYFERLLGREYFAQRQLRKNGLRFFSGPPASPIEERIELGPSERPVVPSFQLDRGRFENDLREVVEREGVELREGWGVRDVELAEDGEPHRVAVVDPEGREHALEARWVIDALSRRRLIAKKLGLHREIEEQASSSWFRVAQKIDVAELVSTTQERWHARDVEKSRWLSTVHLCGTGYWVWLIPLSSGMTSVGVVAESAVHDFRTFGKPEAVREWLRRHEPRLASRLEGVAFEDFIAMKDYRHDTTRVIGRERWACAGEAGFFVDPLYSPGSDMIGTINSLATELVADDLEGRFDPARADALDAWVRGFARLTFNTLVKGSCVFGKPDVTAAKLYWDYMQYWSVACQYFFQRIYELPVSEHAPFLAMLDRWNALNERVQETLQAWAEVAPSEPSAPFGHLPRFPSALADLHLDLQRSKDAAQTLADMENAIRMADEVASEIALRALSAAGPARAAELAERLDLRALKLDPRRFDADEAARRERRKLLPPIVRDMERALGRSAGDDAALRDVLARVGAPGA